MQLFRACRVCNSVIGLHFSALRGSSPPTWTRLGEVEYGTYSLHYSRSVRGDDRLSKGAHEECASEAAANHERTTAAATGLRVDGHLPSTASSDLRATRQLSAAAAAAANLRAAWRLSATAPGYDLRTAWRLPSSGDSGKSGRSTDRRSRRCESPGESTSGSA
jgi:hypothetical protein